MIKYMRNPDVILREEDVDEGGLLFNPDTNEIRVINTTGLFIWSLCDGGHDVASIAEALRHEFEVTDDVNLTEHIERFIEELSQTGLIGVVEN